MPGILGQVNSNRRQFHRHGHAVTFIMKPPSPLIPIVLGALLLSGCASTRNGDPRDPLEPLNRSIHSFNETVDQVALKPLAKGYETILPGPARTGVRNFFSNLDDVTIFANNLLQFKLDAATSDFLRVAFNTSLGFLGVLDVASEMGLKKHEEDFGQTLGRWGVPSGPYLVLPILGPSSFRDTTGKLVDSSYSDLVYELDHVPTRNATLGLRLVHSRAELLDAKEAIDTAALDAYEFNRDFYLERRNALVYDGAPPREED